MAKHAGAILSANAAGSALIAPPSSPDGALAAPEVASAAADAADAPALFSSSVMDVMSEGSRAPNGVRRKAFDKASNCARAADSLAPMSPRITHIFLTVSSTMKQRNRRRQIKREKERMNQNENKPKQNNQNQTVPAIAAVVKSTKRHTGSFRRGNGRRSRTVPVPARLAHVVIAALDATETAARINGAAALVAVVSLQAVHRADRVRVARQPLGAQTRKARSAHVVVAAARAPKAAGRIDRAATHVARVHAKAADRTNVVRVDAKTNGRGGGTRGRG